MIGPFCKMTRNQRIMIVVRIRLVFRCRLSLHQGTELEMILNLGVLYKSSSNKLRNNLRIKIISIMLMLQGIWLRLLTLYMKTINKDARITLKNIFLSVIILYLVVVSLEKEIFAELQDTILNVYHSLFKEENQEFIEIKQKVIEEKNLTQLFEILDLKKKFQLGNYENKNIKYELKPYKNAIQELEKMQYTNNPREKLKHCMLMRNIIKCNIFTFHKGRTELVAMDDELPIIIYIVLLSNIPNIFSELYFLENYVKNDYLLENESKLLTNLTCSLAFILEKQNWKLT